MEQRGTVAHVSVNVRTSVRRLAKLRMVLHMIRTGHWSWTLRSRKDARQITAICNACGRRIPVAEVSVVSTHHGRR